MRHVRWLVITLFIMSVPTFLVVSNVRYVVNAPWVYSYGFDKHNVSSWTGIDKAELVRAGSQIRDYFNNDDQWLDVRVTLRGVHRSIYGPKEILHMRDVKTLIQGVYFIQIISATYLVGFAVICLLVSRRRFFWNMARYWCVGGVLTIGMVLFIGLLAAIGFDRLFLAFHIISFSNDLWQLDPRRDYLIAMFPQGFFFDATMIIALSTMGSALVVSGPFAYWVWHGQRRSTTTVRSAGLGEY